MKILVVDDDPQILEAVTVGFQLQWQDSTVIAASDGEAGLEAYYQHEPDVVVLDVSMPKKNGFEVLQEIRRVSDVPVIMLTARGEELDQVRGLELGAVDYVVKPFSHLALLARIKAVLRRAERIGEALQLRGFREGASQWMEPRLPSKRLGWKDLLFAGWVLFSVGLLMIVR